MLPIIIIMLFIIKKERERERDETKRDRQVMHSTISPHTVTKAQAVISPSQPTSPSVCTGNDGMEYPSGQFSWPYLCCSSQAEHETLRSPWLRASTAQQQPKHQCMNIVPILNPKHSCVPAAQKKMTCVPAENRTRSYSIKHTTGKIYSFPVCRLCF